MIVALIIISIFFIVTFVLFIIELANYDNTKKTINKKLTQRDFLIAELVKDIQLIINYNISTALIYQAEILDIEVKDVMSATSHYKREGEFPQWFMCKYCHKQKELKELTKWL